MEMPYKPSSARLGPPNGEFLKRWVDSFLFSEFCIGRCTMTVVQTSRHRAPPAFIVQTEDCCSKPIETTNRLGMMSYV